MNEIIKLLERLHDLLNDEEYPEELILDLEDDEDLEEI